MISRARILTWSVPLALALAACGDAPEQVAETARRGLVVENPSGERPLYHLLGVLQEGEVASRTFELRNADPEPITILRVQTACGCTVPSLTVHEPDGTVSRGDPRGAGPVAVIPPGGLLEVEFQVDSSGVPRKNTFWLATAHMMTDSPSSAYVHFEMSVFVDAPLQITPPRIDLGDVPVSGGAWGQATAIPAVPAAPVRIEGIADHSPELHAVLDEREHFGQPVWELRVELAPGLGYGPYRGEVQLYVLNEAPPHGHEPRLQQVTIPVHGQVVDDVVARPALLSLGSIDGTHAGGEARIVSLMPGRRIRVADPRIEGVPADSLELELDPIRPDSLGRAQEWRLSLRVVGPVPQPRFGGTVHLSIDDPADGESVALRFSGHAPAH